MQYTGVVTKDNLPVATHANCSTAGADCVVGWKIDGKPSSAKLVRQPMHDHPVFLIGRPDIPQPGCAPQRWRSASATPDFSTSAFSVIRFSGPYSLRERRHRLDGVLAVQATQHGLRSHECTRCP